MNYEEKIADLINRDRKVYGKCSRITYYPLVIKKISGAIIEDIEGKKYIDLLSSASALNLGYGHKRIFDVIKDQLDNYINYTAAYTYSEPLVKLSEELISITPGNFEKKVIIGMSGSDANDGMIKMVRAYTGRSKIISFIGGYHGSTYGAISLSAISLEMRRHIGPLLEGIEHFSYPDCYRCKFKQKKEDCDMECFKEIETALETYIPPDDVAAVVIEPIQGDGGLIVPPKKYIKALKELCEKHRILFVSEEVQQGLGRTGKWFGIENFDVVPDLVVMGKALGSGFPISAVVGKSEIIDSLNPPAHLFTMSGNALISRVATETIRIIKDEGLVEKSYELGNYAIEKFNQLKEKYSIIGNVEGKGLSIGVSIVKNNNPRIGDKEGAKKICSYCFEKGVLIIFLADGVLRFQPPLIISKEEIDRGINVIEEAIFEYSKGNISDEAIEFMQGW